MYCRKCGKYAENEGNFCNYCGAQMPGTGPGPKPKKKKKKGCGVFLLVLLLAVLIGAGVGIALKEAGVLGDESWKPAIAEDLSELRISTEEENEPHLILYAEDTRIPEKEAARRQIHIRIPASMELSLLEVYMNEDTVLASFEPAYLEASDDTVTIDGETYFDYSAEIEIPEVENEDTAVVLTVRMENEESNSLVMYRDIPVTDEMIETLAEVLDDTVAYVNSLGKAVRLDNGTMGHKYDPSLIPGDVLTYLEDHQDVDRAWIEGDSAVYFVTEDGLCGAFTVTEVYEDPDLNFAGSGGSATTSSPQQVFEYDKHFRTVCLDPDVLVVCPLREGYTDRKGNQSESVGRKLAEKLKGDFTLVTDESDARAAMNTLTSGVLEEYGTVMLVTHCGNLSRGDGTSSICPTIYSNMDMDSANEAIQDFMAGVEDADRTCLMYVSGGDYSAARLVFNVNYTYTEYAMWKWNEKIHYDILATSNYFMDLYSDAWFPNTVFYLGACKSYNDATFNQFLYDHGASCVIGYNKNIQVNVEQAICNSLFADMINENGAEKTSVSGRNYNILEAKERGYNVLMYSLAGYSYFLGGTTDASLYAEMDFVYEGYGKVSGTVRDQTGNGLSSITVTAYRYWDGELVEEKTATTESDGTYTFDKLPWGMYVLEAKDGAVADYVQISFDETQRENVDFVLEHTELWVYVHNEDGEFLSDAVVSCQDDECGYTLTRTTDESGNPVFHIEVNTGDYTISVSCKGYEGKNETTNLSGQASRSYTLKKSEVPEDGIIYNGHYYKIFAIKSDWGSARSYCSGLGGHLVSITAQGEQDAVFAYMQACAPDTDLWIGFSDAGEEDNWSTWITGELVSYSNWSPDEPDDGGSGQDYGVICNGIRSGSTYYIAPGQWDDISNSDSTNLGYFICEWDYIPEGVE